MPIDRLIGVPGEQARSMMGAYAGRRLAILGGGRQVWDDFQALTGGDCSGWDVMAVNDVGMFFDGPLEHWYSNHWNQLFGWQAVREFHYPPAAHLHTVGEFHSQIVGWPFPGNGTSGFSAALVGLALGYGLEVLCGIPLDDGGHFFDPPGKGSNFSRECLPRIWQQAEREVFDGRVKSMSGWSREILGAPC